MILALDLGNTTGYAMGGDNLPPRSGIIGLTPDKGDHPGARFLLFVHYVRRLVKSNKITEVYFEEVKHHQGIRDAHIYGAYWGVLTGYCAEAKMPCTGINVKKIKIRMVIRSP